LMRGWLGQWLEGKAPSTSVYRELEFERSGFSSLVWSTILGEGG
jgi:hypothetical protein